MNESRPEYSYRLLREKDESSVKALVKGSFDEFLEGEYWDWKYKENPNFDPSLVAIAEKGEKIIGCNHWLVRDLKFCDALEIKAVLGADITVSPEYRKRGIGTSLLLFLRSSEAFKEKGVIISYMFPNPKMINPLYKPSAYYIPTPSKTIRYVKILNWGLLKTRLENLNRRMKVDEDLLERMSGLGMSISFQIAGAPPLVLKIGDKGVKVEDQNQENFDIAFSIDLPTLERLKGAENKTYKLLKAWLRGKLKIKGSLSKLFKLYRNLWIFKELFG